MSRVAPPGPKLNPYTALAYKVKSRNLPPRPLGVPPMFEAQLDATRRRPRGTALIRVSRKIEMGERGRRRLMARWSPSFVFRPLSTRQTPSSPGFDQLTPPTRGGIQATTHSHSEQHVSAQMFIWHAARYVAPAGTVCYAFSSENASTCDQTRPRGVARRPSHNWGRE